MDRAKSSEQSAIEQASALSHSLRRTSSEMARDQYLSINDFAALFVDLSPDSGTSFDITPEVTRHLPAPDRAAVKLSALHVRQFADTFGMDSQFGSTLTLEDHDVQDHFRYLGKALQGILDPQGIFPQEQFVDHYTKSIAAYQNLLNRAEQFSK